MDFKHMSLSTFNLYRIPNEWEECTKWMVTSMILWLIFFYQFRIILSHFHLALENEEKIKISILKLFNLFFVWVDIIQLNQYNCHYDSCFRWNALQHIEYRISILRGKSLDSASYHLQCHFLLIETTILINW